MSNKEFNNINFDMPKNQSSVIKVVGVGGGGSNAVNHMFSQGIKGVDFAVCNTDAQALSNSPVPTKIQLGASLTEGLGAGANPEVGEQSAIESIEEIKNMLTSNTKMLFITVGMGGGTGTGAAPVIAKVARELDLLTIGIVTMPFSFEGKTRNEQAQKGVERLRQYVDSLVVINNNKLREVYGNLGFKAGFSKADEVLSTAARGIAEVITHHYTQNIDLKDAKTVLSNSGTAIMGSAVAVGQNRGQEAISKALDSPLLNDNKIIGAKNVLLLIVSGVQEITIDEIGEINDYIQGEAKNDVNIIMGVGEDDSLGDGIAVTVIATGFHKDQQNEISNLETKKIVHSLEEEQKVTINLSPSTNNDLTFDMPEPTIPKKEVIEEGVVPEEKIVHTLDMEEETFNIDSLKPISVQEIPVSYEEVYPNGEVEEFKIHEVSSVKVEKEHQEVQTQLSFDLPLGPKTVEEKIAVEDIEVVYEEVKSLPIEPETEQVYFNLADYEALEDTLNNATNQNESTPEIKEPIKEEEIVFEVKVKEPEIESEKIEEPETKEVVSPLNVSISDLKRTAEARRKSLKQFNYKFTNRVNQSIDDIEKLPAYKRMGVELSESTHSSENTKSRTTLDINEDDDIQLRSNNSFLHDNVD